MRAVAVVARLAGVALVVAGVVAMWWPAGLVVGGVALLIVGHEVAP